MDDYDTRSFGVEWNSITFNKFKITIAKVIASFGINVAFDLISPGGVGLLYRILSTGRNLAPLAFEINNLFNEAKKNAKICG